MHFTIHADGGSRGNPGPAGAGAMVRDALGNSVIAVSKYLGVATNNVAEYEALILALEALVAHVGDTHVGMTDVSVKMDSQLVIKQLRGEYRVKHPDMRTQYLRITPLVARFKTVDFTHVPRAQNKDADALANDAMDRGV